MSENMKLTIDTGVRKIEVNAQGECIILPLGDQAFVSGLLELMQEFSEKANKIAESVNAANEDDDSKMERLFSTATLNLETCKEMKSRVDELFHDEACRKVFGDIVPSLAAFAEFFDKLRPFMKEYIDKQAAESKARISKYTKKYHQESGDLNG